VEEEGVKVIQEGGVVEEEVSGVVWVDEVIK